MEFETALDETDLLRTEAETYEYVHQGIRPREDEDAEIYFEETYFDTEVKLLQKRVLELLTIRLSKKEFLSVDDFVVPNLNWLSAQALQILPAGSPKDKRKALVGAWYVKYAAELDKMLMVRAIHAA